MSAPESAIQPNGTLYHNAALSLLVACPLLVLLPPRRLNLGTGALGASWFLSANYLIQERRNRQSLVAPVMNDRAVMSAGTAPKTAKGAIAEVHTREDKEKQKEPLIQLSSAKAEQVRRSRAEEYQDKLDEGAGYGDIIKESIWEVWNQDRGEKD